NGPEAVKPTRIRGIGVVHSAILERKRTHARPIPRIGGHVGSGHGCNLGHGSLHLDVPGYRLQRYIEGLRQLRDEQCYLPKPRKDRRRIGSDKAKNTASKISSCERSSARGLNSARPRTGGLFMGSVDYQPIAKAQARSEQQWMMKGASKVARSAGTPCVEPRS